MRMFSLHAKKVFGNIFCHFSLFLAVITALIIFITVIIFSNAKIKACLLLFTCILPRIERANLFDLNRDVTYPHFRQTCFDCRCNDLQVTSPAGTTVNFYRKRCHRTMKCYPTVPFLGRVNVDRCLATFNLPGAS